MLKLLKNSPQDGSATAKPMDGVKLIDLMQYFPIGCGVRFYPEFQKDIVLQSIVIGYGINDYVIYSHNDIKSQFGGNRHTVLLNDDGKTIALKNIESFCFLLPHIEGIDSRLDYDRRAALGPGGPFRNGNAITLMSSFVDRGAPQVDTTVRRKTILHDQYYANQEVVILDVLPETFVIIDRREHYRLVTRVPITMRFADHDESHQCTLLDFSDQHLKLKFDDEQTSALATQDKSVVITIGLGNQPKTFILSGTIFRKHSDSCVIALDGILKGSHFVDIDTLDILDVRANLLQHPETQKSLKKNSRVP
jgi:hypothetical protein